jgi:hypothetical protein
MTQECCAETIAMGAIRNYQAFVDRISPALGAFMTMWTEEHQRDPTGYPLAMTPDEWMDAFLIYTAQKRGLKVTR